MSWEKGIQGIRDKYASEKPNKKLLNDKRFLLFEEAKISLYKFLRQNPGFATRLLLGVRLYPYQIITLKGMLIGDYSMFVFTRGGGKCLNLNELAFTDKGCKKVIDIEPGEYIQSLKGPNRVLAKTVNTKQKTYKVTTFGGYSTEGLDYHRVLVFNPTTIEFEYRFSKDLQGGEIIPIRKGFDYWPEETDIRNLAEKSIGKYQFNARARPLEDWYYFWGLILGDGYYLGNKNNKNGIGFCSDDIELAVWAQKFICDVCDKPYLAPKRKSCGIYRISFSRKECKKWMEDLGFCYDLTAHQKIIPYKLLNNSKKNICALLSGLMDTDGCVTTETNKEKNSIRTRIEYSSTSKELINQTKMLLLNLGIETSNRVCFKGGESSFSGKKYKCKRAWSCTINNVSTTRVFQKEIGFRLSRKREKLANALNDQHNGDSRYNQTIPCQQYIEKKYGGCFGQNGERVDLSFGGKSISKPKLEKVVKHPKISSEDQDKLNKLLNTDCYFDTVKSVTESESVTVDLQVENEECYFANGFISHNSFLGAIYILLELILNQGTQIGILSSSFRQSKIILQKAEEILSKPAAKLAQDCFTSKKFISKGTDLWRMECGRSSAIALPLANGEKLRGFRFQQILLDEFLNIPKNIFNEVIMPFLSVIPNPTEREDLELLEDHLIELGKMKEEDRYQWPNNKLVLLSSPSFKFEYMYELYKQYVSMILDTQDMSEIEEEIGGKSDAYRVVMQLSYDVLPPQIHDKNLLAQSKSTMSEMQFKREFGAQFVDESDGYFRLSKMAACTILDGETPTVEIKGYPKDEYILSFDPNWAGNASADHFAMQVFKILKSEQKLVLVHSYAIAGVDLKLHQRYFHYILTNFNIVGICGDYNGGLQFIEAWNESKLAKESRLEIGMIDVKLDDPLEYEDDLRSFKSQYNKSKRNYCILRKPSSTWIREANEKLQADIDHKRILFASRDLELLQKKEKIGVTSLKWDIKSPKSSEGAQMVEFIDFQKDNIEMTKNQCANIEIKTNPQGSQTFDLPQHLKRATGPNRARKDSYSALVLGNWFGRVYFDQLFMNPEKKADSTFIPVLI